MLTGGQIRAARALLRWRAEDLAERAQVGVATVKRAEGFDGPVKLTPVISNAIRQAIEAAGIVLLEAEGGTGPGVRLRVPDESTDSD